MLLLLLLLASDLIWEGVREGASVFSGVLRLEDVVVVVVVVVVVEGKYVFK